MMIQNYPERKFCANCDVCGKRFPYVHAEAGKLISVMEGAGWTTDIDDFDEPHRWSDVQVWCPNCRREAA